jgi:hypothetical protein
MVRDDGPPHQFVECTRKDVSSPPAGQIASDPGYDPGLIQGSRLQKSSISAGDPGLIQRSRVMSSSLSIYACVLLLLYPCAHSITFITIRDSKNITLDRWIIRRNAGKNPGSIPGSTVDQTLDHHPNCWHGRCLMGRWMPSAHALPFVHQTVLSPEPESVL